MKNYFHIFLKNKVLGINILGALSLFGANIVLKGVFTPTDYGVYAILVTFVSVVFSFGAMGAEQVLNRFARISDSVSFDTYSVIFLAGSLFCGFVLSIYQGLAWVGLVVDTYIVYLVTICSIYSMVMYNYLRLRGDFSLSLLYTNLWKVIFFILTLCTLFIDLAIDEFLKLFSLLFTLTCMTLLLFTKFSNIKFIKWEDKKAVVLFSVGSLINIGLMTLLGYGDRFLIESMIGLEQLGTYFYNLTVFVFPFVLLANYIGFKKLVSYKVKCTSEIFKRDIFFAIKLSISLVFTVCLFVLFFNILGLYSVWLGALNVDITDSLPYFFLGITKLLYSYFSALSGALVSSRNIIKLNVVTLFLMVLCSYYLLIKDVVSVNLIIYLLSFIWVFRSASIYIAIKRQRFTALS
ncbi:hypothetical protein [Pseudoalteromonas sp. SIMBA_162]|uniref:hypothetical protein n=1 Tax=Pseudoalteromonas sp. SIMBA_162 TaxID=3080867 RepID=UPI00397E8982